MDETLRKAVGRFLDQIEAEDLVEDLLLVEVDWGKHTPQPLDGLDRVFQAYFWG